MNDITLSLLVIIAVGLLVVIIFVLVRRNRAENEKRLAQMAVERGWTLEVVREPLMYGQRIRYKQWIIELMTKSSGQPVAPGSSNVVSSSIWRAQGSGGTILIGPRSAQINLGGLGEALIRQVLNQALGSEAEGMVEVQAGTENFRKNFMIWAKDPEDARKIISPFLETALLGWKNASPLIKRTTEGLQIELRNTRLQKAEDIENLVKLGDFLLAQNY
jgi:hypothetical protein